MVIFFLIITSLFFSDLSKEPPGTLQVGENLFWDKTEISNQHYNEYLRWLLKKFGENSDTLLKSIPDLQSIEELAKSLNTDASTYVTDYQFGLYPVIGVNYEQAKAFCKWRTDRIYEWILRDSTGIYSGKQHSSLMVRINNSIIKKENKLDTEVVNYPEYRLPSSSEWKDIATNKAIRKSRSKRIYPLSYEVGKEILGFNDNVSEITSTRGLNVGSNYKLNKKRLYETTIIPYDQAADWLGFRCVCSLKEIGNK